MVTAITAVEGAAEDRAHERREEDADKAVKDLNNRWFGGRPIYAELTPVTDFREACCRQYETGECTRSGFCNFMHLKPISRKLRSELYGRNRRGPDPSRSGMGDLKDEIDQERAKKRDRSRDRDRDRRRDRSRDRRDRSRSRGRRDRRDRDERGGREESEGSSRVKDERHFQEEEY